jgi:hypothetical protein
MLRKYPEMVGSCCWVVDWIKRLSCFLPEWDADTAIIVKLEL